MLLNLTLGAPPICRSDSRNPSPEPAFLIGLGTKGMRNERTEASNAAFGNDRNSLTPAGLNPTASWSSRVDGDGAHAALGAARVGRNANGIAGNAHVALQRSPRITVRTIVRSRRK